MSNTLIGSHTSTYLETEKNVRVAVESMNNLIRKYVLKIIAADPTSTNLPTLIRESGMFTTVETAGSYNYKLAELYQQGVDHDSVLQNTHSRLEKRNALKFDSLEVGGRNLLLNSNKSLSESGTTYFRVPENIDVSSIKQAVLSCDLHYTNASIQNTNTRIGAEAVITYTDESVHYVGAWHHNTQVKQNFSGRISIAFVVPDDKPVKSISAFMQIRHIAADTISVSRPKLELGTLATDWSPAPEDVATPYVAFTSSSGIWYLDAQAFLDDKNAWETVITNAMHSVSVNSRTPFQLLKSRLDSNKLKYLPL